MYILTANASSATMIALACPLKWLILLWIGRHGWSVEQLIRFTSETEQPKVW